MRRWTRGAGAVAAMSLLVPLLLAAPASGAETGIDAGRAPDRIVVQYAGAQSPTVVHAAPSRLDRTVRALSADPDVVYAEPDVIVRAQDVTPDDALWDQQWGPATVRAPRAWSTTTGSADVMVAVLDSGVDAEHEDLAGAVVRGRNVLADNADTDDDNGHGTAAASIVAARSDNARGIAGMCWRCTILPVKVLGPDGTGYMSDLAEGIRWATDQGATVINMSVAGPDSTRALESAVSYATGRGVVLVASAGNGSTITPHYPAANDDVVSVAASTPSDQPDSYTNRGSWVDVAAPGCNTVASAAVEGGGYRSFCGTSSSAPVVAGALALARSAAPQADVPTVRSALSSTAVAVGTWVRHGRLDAAATVEALPSTAPAPSPDPEPDPEPAPDPSPAPASPSVDRLAGADRYATAAAVSAGSRQPGVSRVYVGTGRSYPDALAAGPAAAAAGGPVLLTGPTSLPPATAAELARLRPGEIVVAGGDGAVSPDVEATLREYGPVRRVAGADRFATAAAIARDAFTAPVSTLYLASGRNFPDALAGGAVAAAQSGPLLLTEPGRLPTATEQAIRALQPARIVVLGGPGAVLPAVLSALHPLTDSVSRISGTDRFSTAGEISRRSYPDQADVVYLATGLDFPDALAGGPAAGTDASPLLLVHPRSLPSTAAAELQRLAPEAIVVLGGPGAVSDAILEAAQAAAAGR